MEKSALLSPPEPLFKVHAALMKCPEGLLKRFSVQHGAPCEKGLRGRLEAACRPRRTLLRLLPCGYSLEARWLYGPVPAREDAPALSTLAASAAFSFLVAILRGFGSRPRCSDRQRAKLP